jgi:hypothetical protein
MQPTALWLKGAAADAEAVGWIDRKYENAFEHEYHEDEDQRTRVSG